LLASPPPPLPGCWCVPANNSLSRLRADTGRPACPPIRVAGRINRQVVGRLKGCRNQA
jgi:hypothetical protein